MTLEQARAKFAWDSVQGCSEAYVRHAKGAPALIMNNGLMQALAFFHEKGHHELEGHLRTWLAVRVAELQGADSFHLLMNKLLNVKNPESYRQATEEALLLLRWIRQFAAALGGK
jgi:CRISPR-associated protein Cmr5